MRWPLGRRHQPHRITVTFRGPEADHPSALALAWRPTLERLARPGLVPGLMIALLIGLGGLAVVSAGPGRGGLVTQADTEVNLLVYVSAMWSWQKQNPRPGQRAPRACRDDVGGGMRCTLADLPQPVCADVLRRFSDPALSSIAANGITLGSARLPASGSDAGRLCARPSNTLILAFR